MKIQPFRDETLTDPEAFRTRLNELTKELNRPQTSVRTMRFQNVRTDSAIVIEKPGLTVGAIVLGGVMPTHGGATPPTAAPWVSNWEQQADGRITLRVGGLAASPAAYAVSLVLYGTEGTKS